MLPPTMLCRLAPILPKTERLRTVMPRTSPRPRTTRHPSNPLAVVTQAWMSFTGLITAEKVGTMQALRWSYSRVDISDCTPTCRVFGLLDRRVREFRNRPPQPLPPPGTNIRQEGGAYRICLG